MDNEKEKYERLILQSKLFSLSSELEPSAYQREQLRMIENLYCYLMSFGREKYGNYGLEITETAKRCIRSYDKNRGQFLPYFLSAWKQEFSHITSDALIDEKLRGIKISEDDRRSVVRYIKLVNSVGTSLSPYELYRRLSDSMEIPIEEVERIALIEEIVVSSDVAIDSEGNEYCVLDQVDSGDVVYEEIDRTAETTEWLREIETAFNRLQERQKPVVSDLMTIRLCHQLPYQTLSMCQCCFLNYRIIENWHSTGSLPSQKEIAEKHGKKEASVSRSMKEFLKKLKNLHDKEE